MSMILRWSALWHSLALVAPCSGSRAAEVGRPLPPWEPGMLDIHHINTGKGDSAFFIFPDGTTFLLDAGDMHREGTRPPRYDAPPIPNGSRRAGQWIARYILRNHPEGREAALDYVAVTHFHGDHMGSLAPDSPRSSSGAYRLTGITDVAEVVPIRRMLDRGWPDYDFPSPLEDPMMDNYRAFLKWQREHQGLRVERIEAGRSDQIVLLRAPQKYPEFTIQNLAVNGWVWTGSGTSVRNRFAEGVQPVENNCSFAFRLSYGAFTYFSGGDLAGVPAWENRPEWTDMESAVAWVAGPVDVYVLDHHGSPDAAGAFLLSILRPRIDIASTWASSHVGPDVIHRLRSQSVYPGPRDIFLTNGMWPGRRENMVELFGEAETAATLDQLKQTASTQGHVVVRVHPGGGTYDVIVVDDRSENETVLSVHGPYQSRGRMSERTSRGIPPAAARPAGVANSTR